MNSIEVQNANIFFANMDINISSSERYMLLGSWQGTMGVIARAVIDLIKHDMCSDSSTVTLEISQTINLVFVETKIRSLYKPEMLLSIYYVAGWHITTYFKAGKKERVNLGRQRYHYLNVER